MNEFQLWFLLRKHSGLKRRAFAEMVMIDLGIPVPTKAQRHLHHIMQHALWVDILPAAIRQAERFGGPVR